ncbi:MAG: extracellular solute-binding protein [Rhodospirillaceae bacterium]
MRGFAALHAALIAALLLAVPAAAETVHGLSLYGPPKYPPDFKHLDYVNPDAPKGGEIRVAAMGSFDTLNPYILRGQAAAGLSQTFETLTEGTGDEPVSEYGRLAETIEVGPDREWVAFTLRPQARFSDGEPVTAADVIWSFETLRDQGHPQYRLYYANVAKVEQTAERRIKFTFSGAPNRELPLIIGQLPVLPRHWFSEKRPFNVTTLEAIPGSGPYQVADVQAGRTISYQRVKNWWGRDLALNRGRFNFDIIRFDYYRDADVAFEAFKAGAVDLRMENSSKNWATGYDIPAVKDGRLKREEIKHEDPQGLQGFLFNTRRATFRDRNVRRALAFLFDFEWTQANLMYGQYVRTRSFFSNSDLAATGLPSAAESALLEPYRSQLPEEVFTQPFEPPKTDGSGAIRQNQRLALELFVKAGWELREGKLVNAISGQPFAFEILLDQPIFERIVQPYVRNLNRVGISATIRMVDSAQYQNRLNNFDFDMIIDTIPQSLSPGNEQRDYWTQASADQPGSRNLAGVRDPVVDALVSQLIAAQDRQALLTATRALDRVLLWNWYVIPQWHNNRHRIAYWDRFGHPATAARYGLPYESTWWVDVTKDAALHR